MPVLFRKRIDTVAAKARVLLATLSAHTVESLQGLSELLNYQATDSRRRQFVDLIEQHKRQRMAFFKVSAGQSVLVDFITLSSALLLLLLATPMVTNGSLDAVYLPLIALAAVAAFLPVIEVADVGRQLSETLAATSRLMQVQQAVPAVQDNSKSQQHVPVVQGLASPKVEFRNLSFCYNAEEDDALNNVNLLLEPGSKVALVGSSRGR